MITFKNLGDKESIAKIKDLISKSDVCVFTTSMSRMPLSSRMALNHEVHQDGTLSFNRKRKASQPFQTITNKKVKLFYSNRKTSQYLSIYGDAIIDIEMENSDFSWANLTKTWFNAEDQDNSISLQSVDPIEVHYWDSSSGGMVTLLRKV